MSDEKKATPVREPGSYDREKFVWEVTLQPPSGETITERVAAYWSPLYEGVKEAIGSAARCQAWLRNKKKIQFQVIGEPKLVTE